MDDFEAVVDEEDDTEVHKVKKEWRKAIIDETGICIRFSCRDKF